MAAWPRRVSAAVHAHLHARHPRTCARGGGRGTGRHTYTPACARAFMLGVALTSMSQGRREASIRKSRPKYWNVDLARFGMGTNFSNPVIDRVMSGEALQRKDLLRDFNLRRGVRARLADAGVSARRRGTPAAGGGVRESRCPRGAFGLAATGTASERRTKSERRGGPHFGGRSICACTSWTRLSADANTSALASTQRRHRPRHRPAPRWEASLGRSQTSPFSFWA